MRLALAALLALTALTLLSTADAATTNGAVVTFVDARTIEVVEERVATGADARELRDLEDTSNDGTVSAEEAADRCRWLIANAFLVGFTMDNYARPTNAGTCEETGMVGPVNDAGEVRSRTTHRLQGVLATTRMMRVRADPFLPASIDISLGAPPGHDIEAADGIPAFTRVSDDMIATRIAAGQAMTVRFPQEGRAWEFSRSAAQFETHARLASDGTLASEYLITRYGAEAQRTRAQLDTGRNGDVGESEIAESHHLMNLEPTAILPLAYPAIGGVNGERVGDRTLTSEGLFGRVHYASPATVRTRDVHTLTLPREAFVLTMGARAGGFEFLPPEGRRVTSISGLGRPDVLESGAAAFGDVETETAVVRIGIGPAPAAPSETTPAPEPAPLGPGETRVTSAVSLYTVDATTLLRLSFLREDTERAAQNVRLDIDGDGDGALSFAEVDAMRTRTEEAMWTVESFPIAMDGLRPSAVRLHSIDAPALGTDASSGAPLATTTIYEAEYPLMRGAIAAATGLEFGSRLSVAAPWPARIDAASVGGMHDERLAPDGTSVNGQPDLSGWRVDFAWPEPPASGPAVPDVTRTTWTLAFSDAEHAQLDVVTSLSGGIASWSRAIADSDRDGVVSADEARAVASTPSILTPAPEDLGVRVDGLPPASVRVDGASSLGYQGSIDATTEVRIEQRILLTFAPPGQAFLLTLAGAGAQVEVRAPPEHDLATLGGMIDPTLGADATRLTGAIVAGTEGSVRVARLVPLTAAAPTSPTPPTEAPPGVPEADASTPPPSPDDAAPEEEPPTIVAEEGTPATLGEDAPPEGTTAPEGTPDAPQAPPATQTATSPAPTGTPAPPTGTPAPPTGEAETPAPVFAGVIAALGVALLLRRRGA